MNVRQISDWALEDRLAIDGSPLVVLFLESGRRAGDVRRYEFRRAAREHPDVAFVEVDLVENPSLAARYSIRETSVVLVFVRGAEAARHSVGPLEATLGPVLGRC